MKIAIVGSRNYPHLDFVKEYVTSLPQDTVIVSGGAAGVDLAAENAALAVWLPPSIIFKPDWSIGKHAGLLRNTDIVNTCDKLVAFWDCDSTGTLDSVRKAVAQNKLIGVYGLEKKLLTSEELKKMTGIVWPVAQPSLF